MSLTLPDLAVVDRSEPYAFAVVDVEIFDDTLPLLEDTAHVDVQQVMAVMDPTVRTAQARQQRRPDRIVRFDLNSRFATAPGDPSPFVRRGVGAPHCGALSGPAAAFCAVMSYR